MLKTVIFALSAASGALISGFGLTTLAWSTLSICFILWINELRLIKARTGYVINDPENYNPVLLSQALENALCQTLKSSRRLILQISNPGVNTIRIEINQGGGLQISDSHRTIPIAGSQGSWIPDHHLPLLLKAGAHSTLVFSPLKEGRISITTSIAPVQGGFIPLLLLPLALFFIFDINGAAAALLSVIIYTALIQHFICP